MLDTKKRAAFFDVDGTLISVKSLISFARYLENHPGLSASITSLPLFNQSLTEKLRSNVARTELNRHYFSLYRGLSEQVISEYAKKWFSQVEVEHDFYIEGTLKSLQELQSDGVMIVLVSGSFFPLLQRLIERFEIDDVICTTPEVVDNIYTGELVGAPCIGETKRVQVLKYALEHHIDLENSWAFGDDDSDEPMLETVGNGVRVATAA